MTSPLHSFGRWRRPLLAALLGSWLLAASCSSSGGGDDDGANASLWDSFSWNQSNWS